ncbi:hypothetical protein EON81_16145 [bacterium]|nr:MAG: hypothetical protein EON81_16145 [bacterium]
MLSLFLGLAVNLPAQLSPEFYFSRLNGPVGQVFAAIALAALAFAGGATWLVSWGKKIRAEIESSLKKQIDSLTKRVAHLEENKSAAHVHIAAALWMAGGLGEAAIPLRDELVLAAEKLR